MQIAGHSPGPHHACCNPSLGLGTQDSSWRSAVCSRGIPTPASLPPARAPSRPGGRRWSPAPSWGRRHTWRALDNYGAVHRDSKLHHPGLGVLSSPPPLLREQQANHTGDMQVFLRCIRLEPIPLGGDRGLCLIAWRRLYHPHIVTTVVNDLNRGESRWRQYAPAAYRLQRMRCKVAEIARSWLEKSVISWSIAPDVLWAARPAYSHRSLPCPSHRGERELQRLALANSLCTLPQPSHIAFPEAVAPVTPAALPSPQRAAGTA